MKHSNVMIKYKLRTRNDVHDNNNAAVFNVVFIIAYIFELTFDTVIVADIVHNGIPNTIKINS